MEERNTIMEFCAEMEWFGIRENKKSTVQWNIGTELESNSPLLICPWIVTRFILFFHFC